MNEIDLIRILITKNTKIKNLRWQWSCRRWWLGIDSDGGDGGMAVTVMVAVVVRWWWWWCCGVDGGGGGGGVI